MAAETSGPTGALAAREIVSTRVLGAVRELVFRAISEPDRLARWWGPKGFSNLFHEFDFRPGGAWRFVMRGPDGTDYLNRSVFVEIVKPERIVLRHETGPRFELTIGLAAHGGGTRITWRMLFPSPAKCERAKKRAVEANEENFDRLEAELARMA